MTSRLHFFYGTNLWNCGTFCAGLLLTEHATRHFFAPDCNNPFTLSTFYLRSREGENRATPIILFDSWERGQRGTGVPQCKCENKQSVSVWRAEGGRSSPQRSTCTRILYMRTPRRPVPCVGSLFQSTRERFVWHSAGILFDFCLVLSRPSANNVGDNNWSRGGKVEANLKRACAQGKQLHEKIQGKRTQGHRSERWSALRLCYLFTMDF